MQYLTSFENSVKFFTSTFTWKKHEAAGPAARVYLACVEPLEEALEGLGRDEPVAETDLAPPSPPLLELLLQEGGPGGEDALVGRHRVLPDVEGDVLELGVGEQAPGGEKLGLTLYWVVLMVTHGEKSRIFFCFIYLFFFSKKNKK